ncbi:unannotated protein [freshwater metagenome]|uniref:Unannotated protein n=1 Tax=freshwater metagenome TaxID=449393 RepID=A0A6J7NU43_9ZZZZ
MVDVTDVVERKFAALFRHESQMSDTDAVRARVTEWMAMTAREAGLPEGRLAESFRRVRTSF